MKVCGSKWHCNHIQKTPEYGPHPQHTHSRGCQVGELSLLQGSPVGSDDSYTVSLLSAHYVLVMMNEHCVLVPSSVELISQI